MSRFLKLALGLAVGVSIPALAEAHPRLTASSPANGAVVGHVRTLQLQFSERLVPAFSGAELIMTGMPGIRRHRPTTMPVRTALGNGGRTLVLTSRMPLPTGTYRLNWHVVSADTHRIAGGLSFAVR